MELMDILLVCLIAFVTAGITGITGVAGGLLPAVFLTPIIGITSVMPVLAIMLLFGSVSRAWINRASFHRDAFRRIAIPAVPMVVLGGIFYAQLEPKMIALMLGSVVLASIPIRRIAKSYEIKTSRSMLSGVGGVFGFLAGSSTGPGLLLVPFMLGYGLSRTSFVATLAVIAALTHVARAATFGSIGLIGQEVLILGLIGGAATIPGNMLGKVILKKMTNHNHEILVDLMAFGGGINFLYLALA